MRSLRTRLVLISTLLPGLAIVGVSALAWYHMAQGVKETVDLRIEGIASRIARDMHPRVDWATFRNRIDITYGDDIAEGNLMLKIRDDVNNQVVYESSNEIEGLEEEFPSGFPERPPSPRQRPEWASTGGPGPPQGPDSVGGSPPANALGPDGKGKGKGKAKSGPKAGKGGPAGTAPVSEDEVELILEELIGAGPAQRPNPRGEPPVIHQFDSDFSQVSAYGKDWRVVVIQERGYYVLAAMDLTPAIAELRRLERGLLIGIPLAILFIALVGWIVVDRAFRPIRMISETASQITTRDLSERMPESRHNDPEIERLTAILNDMMDRLEKGFSHATRFSADVSHELRTPLAVMQGEIETAMRACEPGTEEENRLLVLRGETSRLKSIIRSLMLLAQADVGDLIQKQVPVPLSDELNAMAEDAEIMAEGAGIKIESEIAEDVVVIGDVVLLRQALLNLVNNAIKYNHDNGFVRIFLTKDDHLIRVAVENSGPPISSESQGKVFDRFYRADQARSRGKDGFGLGLSLARAVVEGHGGELELVRSDDDLTRFEVTLTRPDPEELKQAIELALEARDSR